MKRKYYQSLRDWYENLPAKNQDKELESLCQFIGLSEAYFYRHFIAGNGTPKIAYRMLIEKHIGAVIQYNDTPAKAKVA